MRRIGVFALVVAAHLAILFLLWRPGSEPKSEDTELPGSPSGQVATDRDPTSPTPSSRAPSGPVPSPQPRPSPTVRTKADLLFTTPSLTAELERQTQGCRTGVLLDWSNREVLWRKDPDRAVPMASMTKMMTALLLMEAVESQADLSLSTPVKVSKAAYEVGGSQVYLDPRETFSLDELLKCIMIFSANDAAHLVGEFLGDGDLQAFVASMNRRASELTLESLVFHNPHGLPTATRAENAGGAMDLAFLAGKLLEHPRIVKWSSTRRSRLRENTDKPFDLDSRNGLITSCPGVNGMKTGFTQKAGFCVAATCTRGERVLIATVTGCSNKKVRNRLVTALLAWGYEQKPTERIF